MVYGRLSMLTLAELSKQIAAFRGGQISLDDFEDWFRTNSRGAYSIPDVSEAAASVEAAFSKYYFQSIGEQQLSRELANAIRPFVERQHRMFRMRWDEVAEAHFVRPVRVASAERLTFSAPRQTTAQCPSVALPLSATA